MLETGDIILTTVSSYFNRLFIPGHFGHCALVFGRGLKSYLRNYFMDPTKVMIFYNSRLRDMYSTIGNFIQQHNDTDYYAINYTMSGPIFQLVDEIVKDRSYLFIRSSHIEDDQQKYDFMKYLQCEIMEYMFLQYCVFPINIELETYTYCFKAVFDIQYKTHKALNLPIKIEPVQFLQLDWILSTSFFPDFYIIGGDVSPELLC